MRKMKKKLALRRETLQQLEMTSLHGAGIPVPTRPCPLTQEISVCDTCETMTNCQLSACICQ